MNNMLLNNEWVNNEIKKELKSFWKQMKMNQNSSKLMGHSEDNPEREVHSNPGLPKEDRKLSNKQPNSTSKRTRGTTTNKSQSKEKEGNKIRAELNDKTKKTIQRINKHRSQFFEKIKKN